MATTAHAETHSARRERRRAYRYLRARTGHAITKISQAQLALIGLAILQTMCATGVRHARAIEHPIVVANLTFIGNTVAIDINACPARNVAPNQSSIGFLQSPRLRRVHGSHGLPCLRGYAKDFQRFCRLLMLGVKFQSSSKLHFCLSASMRPSERIA